MPKKRTTSNTGKSTLFKTTKNLPKLWLDNQEVAQLLNVSKRTLQTWRSNKALPFSKIGKKCYYHQDHVQEMLLKHLRMG